MTFKHDFIMLVVIIAKYKNYSNVVPCITCNIFLFLFCCPKDTHFSKILEPATYTSNLLSHKDLLLSLLSHKDYYHIKIIIT